MATGSQNTTRPPLMGARLKSQGPVQGGRTATAWSRGMQDLPHYLLTAADTSYPAQQNQSCKCLPFAHLRRCCLHPSRMRVNLTLVKQLARQVAPLGLPLWRQLVAAGSSSSSSNTGGRLSLAPAQIREQLAAYAAHSEACQQFVQQPDNRNLVNHLTVLTQLLTGHDDPLTIAGSEVTDRCVSTSILAVVGSGRNPTYPYLYLAYSWRTLLACLADLQVRW